MHDCLKHAEIICRTMLYSAMFAEALECPGEINIRTDLLKFQALYYGALIALSATTDQVSPLSVRAMKSDAE